MSAPDLDFTEMTREQLRALCRIQQHTIAELHAERAALIDDYNEQVRWHRALANMVDSGITSLGTIRASRAALARAERQA
jgi:hypothetical protein